MLYFYEDEKIAKARVDAFIEEAKEVRRARNVSRERTFRLPGLSSLFANWKTEKKTAVTTQA
jgi:uridine kinase